VSFKVILIGVENSRTGL